VMSNCEQAEFDAADELLRHSIPTCESAAYEEQAAIEGLYRHQEALFRIRTFRLTEDVRPVEVRRCPGCPVELPHSS
jgi:hypothetical protein